MSKTKLIKIIISFVSIILIILSILGYRVSKMKNIFMDIIEEKTEDERQ